MDVLFPTDSTPSIEHSLSASFSFFFFFQLHSNFVKKSSILMKEGKEQLDKKNHFRMMAIAAPIGRSTKYYTAGGSIVNILQVLKH